MPGDADNTGLSATIIERCRAAGFAAAGIAESLPIETGDAFRAWVAAGRHGSMAWLEETAETRIDPRRVLPGARAAIMVADLYAAGSATAGRDEAAAETSPSPNPSPRGRIARYARGKDYHKIIKRRLHALSDALRTEYPSAEFRAFVDTAPVHERELAARAGIGWTGKHTLTINPRLGSYFLLGGILTSLPLEPPALQQPSTDHCGTCTRCIDACPTDAITPYAVDARRCISYLTIEHREAIDQSLHPAIGDWIFGCDICQEVCPHNRERETGVTPNEAYAERAASFDLLEVLNWDEDARRASVSGTAMTRVKLTAFRRNAAIAAGNAGLPLPHTAGEQTPRGAAIDLALQQIASNDAEPAELRTAARHALDRRGHRRGHRP
ncbi:MAG: tRNA epoxyqueuosine(34) reductase QueG [Planctomycetota bacterium]